MHFFGSTGPVDPAKEGSKRPPKNKNKDKDISCFKELGVLFGELRLIPQFGNHSCSLENNNNIFNKLNF
jgi:hypothetical protein